MSKSNSNHFDNTSGAKEQDKKEKSKQKNNSDSNQNKSSKNNPKRSKETTINKDKQKKHLETEGKNNGRSYIYGDNDAAQELVDNYHGKGEVKKENTESVKTDKIVGVYKDIDGNEFESDEIIIVTSKTGAHVFPGFPKSKKKGNK